VERHNSCLNTLAIIEYVRRYHGRPEDLLEGLKEDLRGFPDPLAFLSDPNNWVSADVCRKMFLNARRVTGDDQVAYKIGFESVAHKRLGYIQRILLMALGSPRMTINRIESINEKFNRNKKIDVVSIEKGRTRIRLHWDPNLSLSPDFCAFNRGIYSAIPTVWGLPAAKVEEAQCQFKGASCCEFEVRFEEPSIYHRLRLFLSNRFNLLTETLLELERDKHLLEQKYSEVQNLNRRLQQRVDQLLSIQQASGAILSELNYTKLFPTVLDLFIKAIDYSRGMIMLVDEEEGVLRYVHGVGADPHTMKLLRGYEIPLTRHENILARVAVSGRPVVAQDARRYGLNPNNIVIHNFNPESFVLLPLTAQGKVIGILAADRSSSAPPVSTPGEEFLSGFANQVALAIENVRMYHELKDGFLSSIQALASAVEAKDPYTRGHSERVARFSVQLAKRIGLPAREIDYLHSMCLLHDIGKIGIDRQLLNKKGPIQPSELEIIRRHPLIGEMIVKPLKLSQDEAAIVRNHHERFDGLGYPDGLKGEDIPKAVRVASLCDAFDAMVSDRSYRKALLMEDALPELIQGAGTQFDPELVAQFSEMIEQGELEFWPEIEEAFRPGQSPRRDFMESRSP